MPNRRARATQLPLLGASSTERTRRAWRGAVTRSRTRKGPTPAPRAWSAVILGVDTARVSGWSVWSAGKWIAHGELDTLNASALRSVVADALEVGQAHALPCVLVLEKPYGGNVNVVAALGATRERWLAPWRELATGNVGKVVLVSPSTWRAAVLGGAWASAPREQVRPVEQAMAAGLVGCKPGMQLGGDEAAGVCIGWWGTRAGEVGRLLGKRAKAASIAAWRAP